jgi:hypothetical protein
VTDQDGTYQSNKMGSGVAVGAAITVGTLVMLAVSLSVEGIAQRVVLGVTVTIIVAAYLSGLACAIHRPLRRLGIGILVGLTVAFPVTLGLAALILAAASEGR